MAMPSPNVLLVIMDDMGWGDLRCHGNDLADTPHIDALARSGLEAVYFYASPVCSPTRASVLTGRYYPRTGVSLTGQGYETMRAGEVTIADILGQNGYATGCFGKWHNGTYFPYTADARGFSEFVGFNSGYINSTFDATLDSTSGPRETEGFLVDVLAESACDFISRNRDQPWFCYLPFNVPHVPFQAPDDLFLKYRQRGCHDALAAVYAMNEAADRAIGRILAHLESLALKDDTIVVFMSDHGPNTPRYNAGMRGIKGCLHEGGVRVPLIISWPKCIPAQSRMEQAAAHIDLVPTLLGLTGVESSHPAAFDGIDLAATCRSGGLVPIGDRLLFDFFNRIGAVRTETHRLLIPEEGPAELYELATDPGEAMNLLSGEGQEPVDIVLAERLRVAYQEWAADVGAGKSDRPAIPVGHHQSSKVVVRSLDVETKTNSLRLLPGWGSQNWLTNWKDLDCAMTWRLEVVEAGRYEFELIHTCDPGNEGSSLQLTVDDQELTTYLTEPFVPEIITLPDRVTPRPGPPQQTWGSLHFGTLELPAGPTSMTLRALTIPGKSVADVWGVRITHKPE
jgi:arylsulfatase A